ncbi:3-hydroxyacyl-CoA dehydrogenase NAD-binding domain-containing protein [Garicola koreensis]|uniref:Ketoreductase RED1 n=1 Tax=Garicola koreensis TaxID=1262554 RepID=A0A7W5TWB1_9MICC|nr:3-hydroxyacyl-CoA dehydrogenase NAD-binding domain-containing protein [Garicola koreensis]MBB3668049.1 ketoreductase RED1 [Garicola koreensis]
MPETSRSRQPHSAVPDQAPAAAAVIGAGTIGLSWARLFASCGSTVTVFDPREDLQDALAAAARDAGLPEEALSRAESIEAAVAEADFVQESGPEDPKAKAELFAQVAQAAPATALLISSSSAITATQIAGALPAEAAERVLIGHPFNPPHLMPLVEVVPGERTAQQAVSRALDLYRAYGREPILLKREVRGFVGNRLQNAVLREAAYLVQSGVVDAADLDTAVKNSLGLRWAAVGPLEGMHLGGGDDGLAGFMKHIGPSFAAIDRHEPDMSESGLAPVVAQTDQAYGLPPAPQTAARRDRIQQEILRVRNEQRS